MARIDAYCENEMCRVVLYEEKPEIIDQDTCPNCGHPGRKKEAAKKKTTTTTKKKAS
jgi:hypothetical protein